MEQFSIDMPWSMTIPYVFAKKVPHLIKIESDEFIKLLQASDWTHSIKLIQSIQNGISKLDFPIAIAKISIRSIPFSDAFKEIIISPVEGDLKLLCDCINPPINSKAIGMDIRIALSNFVFSAINRALVAQ